MKTETARNSGVDPETDLDPPQKTGRRIVAAGLFSMWKVLNSTKPYEHAERDQIWSGEFAACGVWRLLTCKQSADRETPLQLPKENLQEGSVGREHQGC